MRDRIDKVTMLTEMQGMLRSTAFTADCSKYTAIPDTDRDRILSTKCRKSKQARHEQQRHTGTQTKMRLHPPKMLKPKVVSTMTAAKASLKALSSPRFRPRPCLCPSVLATDRSTVRLLLQATTKYDKKRVSHKGRRNKHHTRGDGISINVQRIFSDTAVTLADGKYGREKCCGSQSYPIGSKKIGGGIGDYLGALIAIARKISHVTADPSSP